MGHSSLLSHFRKLRRHELKLHIDGGVGIYLPGVVRHRSDSTTGQDRAGQCDRSHAQEVQNGLRLIIKINKKGDTCVIAQKIQPCCLGLELGLNRFCSPELVKLTHCNGQRPSKMTGAPQFVKKTCCGNGGDNATISPHTASTL